MDEQGRRTEPSPTVARAWGEALQRAFEGPLWVAAVVLWSVGVLLAGGTAVVAWTRLGRSSSVAFITAATILGALLIGVVRRSTWALTVTLLLLGAQAAGVAGTTWELTHRVAGGKAHELRRLGVNPRLGIALNLLYSAVAFAVFVWAVKELRVARGSPRRSGPSVG
jgi:hypothetical protein